MGVIGAVVLGLTAAKTVHSAYESHSEKRKARHAKEDQEAAIEAEIAEAKASEERRNEDRRRRIAMYGRQSTFSAGLLPQEDNKRKKLLGD